MSPILLDAVTVTSTLYDFFNILVAWAKPIALIAFVISGIGFFIAGKKGNDGAKQVFFNVIIGAVIVGMATILYDEIIKMTSSITGL